MSLSIEKQTDLTKKTDKPKRKNPKYPPGEAWFIFHKGRVRIKGRDTNYHKIAKIILSGKKIRVFCKLTGKDMTEKIVLNTMNTYLADHTGNLEKYLKILKGE